MVVQPSAMTRQIQQLLGRQLAALYASLPPVPADPRLSALVRRLEQDDPRQSAGRSQ